MRPEEAARVRGAAGKRSEWGPEARKGTPLLPATLRMAVLLIPGTVPLNVNSSEQSYFFLSRFF